MHEVDMAFGQHTRDEGDFGQRRTVEMANAAFPQGLQNDRFGIAFDGVEHVAIEAGDEIFGGRDDPRRVQTVHRFAGAFDGDNVVDRREGGGEAGAEFAHGTGHLA
jgi:hypothetical protein